MSDSNRQVVSVSPVVLPAPGRAVELQLRVSAPVTGDALPILLLSHGHGRSNYLSSLNGYAPLASLLGGARFRRDPADAPELQDARRRSARGSERPRRTAVLALSRATDMTRILDGLAHLETLVPMLAGRLDHHRIAIAGHSLGGHTTSLLLGARLIDPADGTEVNLADARIKAGVLLAAPGRGGDALSAYAAEHIPCFRTTDFSHMTTPALVIAGDQDASPHLTVAGAAWHADPYTLAPGPKSLVTLFGGEHGLGGIAGYDVAETTDENPARVALVQQLTSAYLRSALYPEDPAWTTARAAFETAAAPLGRIESKA